MSPDGSIFGSIHSCGSSILFHFAPLSLLVGAIKSSGRMAASAATIDGGRHESPGRMPLRGNPIRGGGKSVQGRHLPLRRLSDTIGICVSYRGADGAGHLPTDFRNAEGLPEDGRERKQPRTNLLPELWDAYLLCTGRRRHQGGWIACRNHTSAG